MSEKKNIVIIPGGKWQVPIVKKVKSMGHSVYTIDSNENAPTFEIVDGYCVGDIFDARFCAEYCKNVHADALLTEECDIVWKTIVEVAQMLGLHTMDEDASKMFVNKHDMREFAESIDFPHPRYKLCANAEEAAEFLNRENGKAIIKPIDSYSSRGVFVVCSEADIFKHVEETLSQSRTDKKFLVEQYIDGTEFTVDGIKTPFGHFTLAISEKKHYKHNESIANELYFTYRNPKFDYSHLRELTDRYVNSSPLKFGLTHTEYKYENGEFYMMETAARGGGNLISSHIVPYMSGVDNYEYLINAFLGKDLDIAYDFSVKEECKDRAAVLKFFTTPGNGGLVKRIFGTEYLDQTPDIISWKLNFKKGDYINPPTNDGARIGYYIACCESEKQLQCIMEEVEERIRFEYE